MNFKLSVGSSKIESLLLLLWLECIVGSEGSDQLEDSQAPGAEIVCCTNSQRLVSSFPSGFDELTCHCGASVIYPPVPCGTRPPECTQTCARIHECDHPGESLQSPHLTACSHLDLGGAVQSAPAHWLGSVLVS